MSKGNGNRLGQTQVLGVKQNVPEVHRIDVEELHAHLSNEHGCGMAQALAQNLLNERIQSAARVGIVNPDGTVGVNVDAGELFSEPGIRRRFEGLHRAHHNGTGTMHSPAFLHRWEADDAEG